MFGDRKKRNEQRLRDIALRHLDQGEDIETLILAITRIRLLPLALGLFPFVFVLEYTGNGSWGAWVTGAYLGVVYTWRFRTYVVVETRNRLHLMKLSGMGRKVTEHLQGPHPDVGLTYRDAWVSGIVTLRLADSSVELQVNGDYRERARALVREHSG